MKRLLAIFFLSIPGFARDDMENLYGYSTDENGLAQLG